VLGDRPPDIADPASPECEVVCEPAVDRERVERVLEESPEFLDTMLQAPGEALGAHAASEHLRFPEQEQEDIVSAMAAD
jgi:hypothetical protein